ncbi:hypothetical protein CRG98_005918 [Punica granatum]|uniref:Zinc finger PMZ-type domain-containing protein n=1 Tax=Punica granatum TaxID=22663 RepID=A0A2I0KYX4_PUNGR|nr:hypothetical protein CRG98_005918 [Punica granatum]
MDFSAPKFKQGWRNTRRTPMAGFHCGQRILRCHSLRVWDLTGIPCKHTMLYNSQRLEEFVNPLLRKEIPQMPTFAEASFFQPITAPPVRAPPVRPPPVRPPHTPITAHTMEAASSGTAARFAAYFQPRRLPPN